MTLVGLRVTTVWQDPICGGRAMEQSLWRFGNGSTAFRLREGK